MAKKASAPRAGIVFADSKNIRYSPEAYDRNGYDPQWRPVFCAGYEIVDGKRVYHHFEGGEKCKCEPGPHVRAFKWVYSAKVDELALPGGRGSGKSENSFGLMMTGDVVSGGKPYIDNPEYRGLVLRRNAKDLDDWVGRANDLYGKIGAKLVKSPTIKFTFPCGAEILCDHLQDESAYQKYWGQQFARILIEECPQIPSEETYKKLRMSCRVKKGIGMRAMMIVIGNPDGPGLAWFTKRFIRLRKENGDYIKSDEIWKNPKGGQTRVFVHSTIHDNPYLYYEGSEYLAQLESIDDEQQRRRYLHGDFDALIGQYFGEFRPHGPLPGEPDNARHVAPRESVHLEPWWPRLVAMDIGYKHWSAVLKAALTPKGQIVIYDELVESEVTAEEWGEQIALWCRSELAMLPNKTIPLVMSHEAFGQRGEGRSLAQLVEQGVRNVLGAGTAVLLNMAKADGGEDEFFGAIADSRGGPRIIIRQHFNRKRVPGWQFIRSLMRFRSRTARPISELDQVYARQLLETSGSEAMLKYLSEFESAPDVVIPKLQITDNCTHLIEAIQSLVYDTDGTNPEDVKKTETIEDDLGDAFNYLCSLYRVWEERLPRSVFMDRVRKDAIARGVPDDQMYRHMVNESLRFEEQDNAGKAFSYAMGSSRQRVVRYLTQ